MGRTFRDFAADDILETAIKFDEIGAAQGDSIGFTVSLKRDREIVETWPRGKFISVPVPAEESAHV